MATYRKVLEQAPFEMIQPGGAPPREWRERQEFVLKDGRPFRHDKGTDEWCPIVAPVSGHATDYAANQKQRVFDKKDVDATLTVDKAEVHMATGRNDYIQAAAAEFGDEHFIISGGLVGTVWSAGCHVGQINLYQMMIEAPDFIDYLCKKILEESIETIRLFAAAGGDAIWIDDATATSDVISVEHYERFSMPYLTQMVEEIHRHNHKAVLIYFGGIADRLEQIASIGADVIQMEASMKNYVNDMETTARTIGDRMALFSNIDPIGVLQNGTDEQMDAEIRRQVAAASSARGLILSPSSPITPSTPLARVQRFIERSRELGRRTDA